MLYKVLPIQICIYFMIFSYHGREMMTLKMRGGRSITTSIIIATMMSNQNAGGYRVNGGHPMVTY